MNELPGFADKSAAGPAVAVAADGFVSDLYNFLAAELDQDEVADVERPDTWWGFERLQALT